jgi:curved DNA-binding protein CbpA
MAIRKYFPEVLDINSLRTQFREFCLKLHPDKPGGNAEAFKAMKAEYDYIIKLAASSEAGKAIAEDRKAGFTFEGEQVLAEAIERFLRYPGIVIEICGSWLWMTFETFQPKEVFLSMIENGANWSKSKKKYYYSPYAQGFKGKRKSRYSMDRIRNEYGSRIIKGSAKERELLAA